MFLSHYYKNYLNQFKNTPKRIPITKTINTINIFLLEVFLILDEKLSEIFSLIVFNSY